MKLTLSKTHHLVTEKYGHLVVAGTIEMDTETDHLEPGLSYQDAIHGALDGMIEPTLERLNRSLQEDSDLEFIQAFIAAK